MLTFCERFPGPPLLTRDRASSMSGVLFLPAFTAVVLFLCLTFRPCFKVVPAYFHSFPRFDMIVPKVVRDSGLIRFWIRLWTWFGESEQMVLWRYGERICGR